MKIKRPDWESLCNVGTDIFLHEKSKTWLDVWFDREIQPVNKILEEGVEVYGCDNGGCNWQMQERIDASDFDTHKALLINIQPIMKETREERFETFIQKIATSNDSDFFDYHALSSIAKALLEDK